MQCIEMGLVEWRCDCFENVWLEKNCVFSSCLVTHFIISFMFLLYFPIIAFLPSHKWVLLFAFFACSTNSSWYSLIPICYLALVGWRNRERKRLTFLTCYSTKLYKMGTTWIQIGEKGSRNRFNSTEYIFRVVSADISNGSGWKSDRMSNLEKNSL